MGYSYKKADSNGIATEVRVLVEGISITKVLDGLPDYKAMIKRRLSGLTVFKDNRLKWNIAGRIIRCQITHLTGPTHHCRIDPSQTAIIMEVNRTTNTIPTTKEDKEDSYFTSLTDTIYSSIAKSETYQALGIPVAKSILIHGVSGVGKRTLAKKVGYQLSTMVLMMSIYELLVFTEEEYDTTEFMNYNPLTQLMKKARASCPCILIIDDLNALSSGGDKTTKIVDILSNEINKLNVNESVCIIGIANELKLLPDSLRKTDIFRQHMSISIPTLPQRKALLNTLLRDKEMGNSLNVSISESMMDDYVIQLSIKTSGYVVHDLKHLIRQAYLKALRKEKDIADQLSRLNLTSTHSSRIVEWSDFEYALEHCRPSQIAEVESTLPKRDWSEIGGYQSVIKRIKQSVLLPLLNPEVFTKLGIYPPSGLLLYGPTGCGKTVLVQALISDSMMNVISIRGPEIFSKYLGETEDKIRRLFATAKKISPCIIFIDEMDSLGTKRGFDQGDSSGGVNERVLSTLLNEMDGVEGRKGVVVIGCTNRPDQIDDAILRPGRLDQLIYVCLPTLEDRLDIIKTIMKRLSIAGDVDPVKLAENTEFCSGADLENLFREAGTIALRRNIEATAISKEDVETVIVSVCTKAEDRIMQGNMDLYERFLHDHTL